MTAGVGSAGAASSSKHKRTLRLYTSVMGRRAKSEGWSFILDKIPEGPWKSAGQSTDQDHYNNDKPPPAPSPISSVAGLDDCSSRNRRESTWSYLKMFNAKNAKVLLMDLDVLLTYLGLLS